MNSLLKLFALGAMIFIAACSTYNPENEILEADRTPPMGYDPVFISNVSNNASSTDIAKAFVSRIDMRDPSKLKFYIHVVDSNYDFISGLSPDKVKDLWCGFRRTTNFDVWTDDYEIYEVKPITAGDHSVALVMDHSGSMGEQRALAVQNAAENFINRKKDKDKIALIKYDYRIGIEASLSDNKDHLKSKLQKNGLAGYGATTASSDAVHKAVQELAQLNDDSRKIVMVFTDGYDNSSNISLDSVITYAVQNGVIICGIDFGYNVLPNYLEKLTSETGGIYHHIYGTHEFDLVFDDVYNRLYNYYVLEIPQPNFGEHHIAIDICPPGQKFTIEAEFNNMPHIGEVTLLNVYFDTNSDKIKTESQPAIDRVGALLMLNKDMTIELRGHTDSDGDENHNLDLSKRRAEAVKNALITYGISENRITWKGFGESMPVADNNNNKGRSKNRRTEFIIRKQ